MSGQKTIIISTHYIEEAQNSDYIAMMRKGVLIAECDRVQLQDRYHEINLEKIFLHLAIGQDCEQVLDKSQEAAEKFRNVSLTCDKSVVAPRKRRPAVDRRHLQVLLKRNFLFILRSLG